MLLSAGFSFPPVRQASAWPVQGNHKRALRMCLPIVRCAVGPLSLQARSDAPSLGSTVVTSAPVSAMGSSPRRTCSSTSNARGLMRGRFPSTRGLVVLLFLSLVAGISGQCISC